MNGIRPLGVILLLAGCAPAAPSANDVLVDPTIVPRPRSDAPWVAPTKSHAECADLVAKVGAHPDSFPSSPPRLKTLTVPTIAAPIPPEVIASPLLIRQLIDENGHPVRDSTAFSRVVSDRRWASALRGALDLNLFSPAVLQGCAVPGHFVTNYQVERTGPRQ